jgi:hypothetical protein
LQPNTGNIIISARHALDDKLKGSTSAPTTT